MLTGVYGPQRDNKKNIFLNELHSIRATNELPWVILGDFNIIRFINETMSNMNIGTTLEFSPNPSFSKLDRVLILGTWNTLGATYTLCDQPATASDHVPLLFSVQPHSIQRRRLFKFELFWLRHPDCTRIVREAWDSIQGSASTPIKLQEKLRAVAKAL